MSSILIPERLDTYDEYYHYFKQCNMFQLLDTCEHNGLSIYGDRILLIDRLAHHFNEKNKPRGIQLCLNSIKNILFRI